MLQLEILALALIESLIARLGFQPRMLIERSRALRIAVISRQEDLISESRQSLQQLQWQLLMEHLLLFQE